MWGNFPSCTSLWELTLSFLHEIPLADDWRVSPVFFSQPHGDGRGHTKQWLISGVGQGWMRVENGAILNQQLLFGMWTVFSIICLSLNFYKLLNNRSSDSGNLNLQVLKKNIATHVSSRISNNITFEQCTMCSVWNTWEHQIGSYESHKNTTDKKTVI